MDDSPERDKEGLADEGERHMPARPLADEVGEHAARKLRARNTRDEGVWFGLGMFGVVGWSVAVPTLAGIALGIWVDARWPSRFSWTLMLLFAGLALGCLNAWNWLQRERQADGPADEETPDE